jgi:hypothetical protein
VCFYYAADLLAVAIPLDHWRLTETFPTIRSVRLLQSTARQLVAKLSGNETSVPLDPDAGNA